MRCGGGSGGCIHAETHIRVHNVPDIVEERFRVGSESDVLDVGEHD